MKIDHLVVLAEELETGASAVARHLGVAPGPGGRHERMGTHNRVLSLGGGAYLEVIAVDPDAPAPDRPRWYGLDDFSGLPRLAHWALRVDNIAATLGEAPIGMGEVLDFTRGDLVWSMTVPRDGMPPGEGLLPALLQWKGASAADHLPPTDLSLKRLVLRHPQIDGIARDWPALLDVPGISLEPGRDPGITAEIVSPRGLRRLSGPLGAD